MGGEWLLPFALYDAFKDTGEIIDMLDKFADENGLSDKEVQDWLNFEYPIPGSFGSFSSDPGSPPGDFPDGPEGFA